MIQDISKKPFVFIFQLETRTTATARILALLLERSIEVDEFYFHNREMNQGRLMIHCNIERDRIWRTATLLDKLPGVLKLDWMESKRHGQRG